MKAEIYFDNASTTKMSAEVLQAMMPIMTECYGNSNSVHEVGRDASKYIDDARDTIAKTLNVSPSEIYFTSGGTEANNWAIIGIAMANRAKGNHIITSKFEHHSVLDACAFLEKNGFKVTYLDVDKNGFVNFAELLGAITPQTILVSIMSANNEIGTIQNIKAIAQTVKEKGIIFHTDAVQLYGSMRFDCQDMGIDAMSISSHKIYGPKGVGALYISNKIDIDNLHFGGNQERGRRGGTLNVAGIVGFAKAVEVAYRDLNQNQYKLKSLSEYFVSQLTKEVPDVIINGYAKQKLPKIVSATFVGIDGSALLMMLDLKGVYVSTGSACMSNSVEVSHVLRAMGISDDLAKGTIRFSFSKNNEYEEVDRAVAIIKESVAKLRAYSPTYSSKSVTKQKRGRKKKDEIV